MYTIPPPVNIPSIQRALRRTSTLVARFLITLLLSRCGDFVYSCLVYSFFWCLFVLFWYIHLTVDGLFGRTMRHLLFF
ncbi:hypothetical protein BDN70DRAFT_362531 [Pholiota conissans]|uniref:Uncharacterized protein n=1 Tax=Pholiota conissans TaxID=109636 RepID=A0A9P6CVM3_9AGAR|nr:hypothetical protein BDN70DRAFT_362531 [Pholiota conissans]